MVEVKAITSFTDKESGVFHVTGDLFSCEDKRAKELVDKNAVVIVKAEAPKKPAPKKTATKK